MPSLYPENVDTFRDYVDDFDEMIAQDLNDIFDVVETIQAELGVNPAGKVGTVHQRLFGQGSIGTTLPGWRRLQYNGEAAFTGLDFLRSFPGRAIIYSPAFAGGPDTVFGDGVPGIFGALQWPIDAVGGGLGAQGYGGAPWRSMISIIDPDVRQVRWVGKDGDGAEFSFSNSTAVQWGFFFWGLFT